MVGVEALTFSGGAGESTWQSAGRAGTAQRWALQKMCVRVILYSVCVCACACACVCACMCLRLRDRAKGDVGNVDSLKVHTTMAGQASTAQKDMRCP